MFFGTWRKCFLTECVVSLELTVVKMQLCKSTLNRKNNRPCWSKTSCFGSNPLSWARLISKESDCEMSLDVRYRRSVSYYYGRVWVSGWVTGRQWSLAGVTKQKLNVTFCVSFQKMKRRMKRSQNWKLAQKMTCRRRKKARTQRKVRDNSYKTCLWEYPGEMIERQKWYISQMVFNNNNNYYYY